MANHTWKDCLELEKLSEIIYYDDNYHYSGLGEYAYELVEDLKADGDWDIEEAPDRIQLCKIKPIKFSLWSEIEELFDGLLDGSIPQIVSNSLEDSIVDFYDRVEDTHHIPDIYDVAEIDDLIKTTEIFITINYPLFWLLKGWVVNSPRWRDRAKKIVKHLFFKPMLNKALDKINKANAETFKLWFPVDDFVILDREFWEPIAAEVDEDNKEAS